MLPRVSRSVCFQPSHFINISYLLFCNFKDTKERRVALQDAQGYRVPLYISTSLTKAPTISFFTAIGLMLVSIGLSIWVNRLGYTRRLKWFEHADNLFIILSGILIVHQFIGLLCHGLFFENIRSAGGRAGLGLGFYMSLVCIVILGVQISVLLIWKKKKKKDAGKGAKDNGEDVFEEKLDLVGKGEREGEGKDVDV